MKTNTATVRHVVVSGVESLTLAHKQASVQPSSPSPQALACLNLTVRLISSLSTPTGLADAQLTAAFIRTYRVGVQLSRPLRSQLCRRGISVETAQRVETDDPKSKTRLGCGYSGVRHLLGNTWHESGPELSQLFGWSVSTMDRDQAWPLSPHRPIAQTMRKHWKGAEAARGTFVKDAFTWGGGQEILAEGVFATQQWLVVMQEKMHSHQLIPTVVGNWSAFSSPQRSNFYHCSPFS